MASRRSKHFPPRTPTRYRIKVQDWAGNEYRGSYSSEDGCLTVRSNGKQQLVRVNASDNEECLAATAVLELHGRPTIKWPKGWKPEYLTWPDGMSEPPDIQ